MSGAVEVHHRSDGPVAGSPLVLAASLGTDLGVWEQQVPMLARYLRVIRYDARGHGRSPAPPGPYSLADLGADLIGLLDRLGITRADVCGLSIGGAAAMWVAAHAPQRVGRLILICSSAWFSAEVYAQRAERVRRDGLGPIVDAVVGRWFTPAFAARRPEAVAAARSMLLATPVEGYAASCEALAAIDLQPDLWRIVAPTLIVAGADDLAVPGDHPRRLASAIAGSRLAVVPSAAHLANVEQPQAVAALMATHLGIDGLDGLDDGDGTDGSDGSGSLEVTG